MHLGGTVDFKVRIHGMYQMEQAKILDEQGVHIAVVQEIHGFFSPLNLGFIQHGVHGHIDTDIAHMAVMHGF